MKNIIGLGFVGGILTALVIMTSLVDAFVFMKMWNWYAPYFLEGAKSMGFAAAWGVFLTLGVAIGNHRILGAVSKLRNEVKNLKEEKKEKKEKEGNQSSEKKERAPFQKDSNMFLSQTVVVLMIFFVGYLIKILFL